MRKAWREDIMAEPKRFPYKYTIGRRTQINEANAYGKDKRDARGFVKRVHPKRKIVSGL